EGAGRLDERVAGGLRLEWIRGRRDRQARLVRQVAPDTLGEFGVGVQAGADRGAAERDLAQPLERRAHARVSLTDLGGVTAELLAEGDGDGVHQVRAPGLDNVVELHRLRLQRLRQSAYCGQEVVRD